MGEKKGKALALELIDDLLNSKTEVAPVAKDNTHQLENAPVEAPVAQAQVQEPLPVDADIADVDDTIRLAEPSRVQGLPAPQPQATPDNRVRASVGRFGAVRAAGAASATEAALAQSESLRVAQNRILELEAELERLRLQNEELGAAGETLRGRADELLAENQSREGEFKHARSMFETERGILSASKDALVRDNEDLRRKIEEMELRLSSNIQKIRVRERELENRLELVKMESAALVRSKDELILELKRQMDQINLELTNYRTKNQELNRQTNDKQEMLRRTVKALRLALSMLEGEEEAPKSSQRKPK